MHGQKTNGCSENVLGELDGSGVRAYSGQREGGVGSTVIMADVGECARMGGEEDVGKRAGTT